MSPSPFRSLNCPQPIGRSIGSRMVAVLSQFVVHTRAPEFVPTIARVSAWAGQPGTKYGAAWSPAPM